MRRRGAPRAPSILRGECDDPEGQIAQKHRVAVSVEAVLFSAVPKRLVGAGYLPRKGQGKAETEFGDRLGKDGTHRKNVDVVAEAVLVVNVGQEITLDVDDRLQLGGSFEALR